MFPNKLRFENFNNKFEFFGEKKIVTLMKENIIFETKIYQEYVSYYKNLKNKIKL